MIFAHFADKNLYNLIAGNLNQANKIKGLVMETATTTKVKDPVCGMTISPEKATGTSDFAGENYYFCSPVCKEKFDANQAQYVKETSENQLPTNGENRTANNGVTGADAMSERRDDYSTRMARASASICR